MNAHSKILRTLTALAVISVAAGNGQTTTPATAPRNATGNPAPATQSLEEQIQTLRLEMEGQIQELRQELADRDRQLRQARQAAGGGEAPAEAGPRQSEQPSSALQEKTDALKNLQGAVASLQTQNASLRETVEAEQGEQVQLRRSIESPDTVRYKGITISPIGSFLAGETVYRNEATGGGLSTPFTGIPLNDQAEAQYSEFYGTGRQSRIAILAQGKLNAMTMTGYYEGDWLGTGITSNNNQSNSYVFRQRQVWAQAAMDNGWSFTGGQMWSLATETGAGLQNRSEMVPLTIDPQYTAGFVWARQYGFRITKNFSNKVFAGVSAENPQIPGVAGHNLPYNFVVGEVGTGGGLYNPTANYAANLAPDLIAKMAFEPGWGHYEIFGIGRFFRARVYPNDTPTSTPPSASGAYNDTTVGGGIGGGFRVPALHKRLDVGLKGLWGDGIGRYGSSQIADTTVRPGGQLALIHGFSALSTFEYHATSRLDIYLNYGGDYAGRRYFVTAPGKATGYGSPFNVETGCDTEQPPASSNSGYTPAGQANCAADTKDVQEAVAGYWFNLYSGPKGRLRQGLQYSFFARNIWSGVGRTPVGTDNMFFTSFRYYLP